MNNGRTEYTFLWTIENYSYCWQKNGERLLSPEFTPDGLEDTAWSLRLYPRGEKKELKGYISLFLYRVDNDSTKRIPLMFELSLLAADGSSICSQSCEYTFRWGRSYGIPEFIQMCEIHKGRKEKHLPQDTLSLSCKIWRGEGNLEQVTQVSARTRIRIQEISFLHVVESFSILESNQKKTVQHRLPTQKGCAISSSVYFTSMFGKEKITIEFKPSTTTQILIKCKLSLLDASGIAMKCGGADNRPNTTKQNIQKLTLSLTREDILKGKSKYLPDDKLSLLCECVFSKGKEHSSIERILHEIPSVALNQASGNNQDKYVYNPIENLREYPDALDTLETIYKNQFLTDVEIKTKTNSFPAHKMWLCARSPVFTAMLTSDMREKNSNIIPVDDLEDETVQQLLLFLYTDNLEKLQWESAVNLYYTGDKYAIEKLKEICSSFLIDNITTSSATELLLLADTHNDSDLKKAAEDFIFKHEEQVFGSEEWEKLIEINPELVSKTMLHKYKRKREPVKIVVKIRKTQY